MDRSIDPVRDNDHPLTRHVPLDGTFNLQDVGGYATGDGRETRWQTLWRSDSLHRLNRDDQERLLCLGLRTIIDLRSVRETMQAPNVFATSPLVNYHNIPLIPAAFAENIKLPEDLAELYTGVLDHCQSSIKAVFDTLLDSTSRPCLIHCTAGKDRTGIMTALILGAVGVPDETIVADYAVTERYLQGLISELQQNAKETRLDAAFYARMLACHPELMARTLTYIHQRYGGLPAYLHKLGLNEGQLEDLRHMLVA